VWYLLFDRGHSCSTGNQLSVASPSPGCAPLVPDQRTVESGIYAVYKYYNISTNIIVYKIMIPRNNVE
jgi:hypothetical protein